MILIYLSAVWVAGVFLGSILSLPPLFYLSGLVPLLLLFFTHHHRKAIILASLGIFLFVAAAVYAYGSLYTVDESRIRYYNDTGTVAMKGVVAGDPDIRDKSTRLTLTATEIFLEDGWREVEGKVLVIVPRYPEYEYGDLVGITGEPQTPPMLDDFDYQGYLAHQGIYTTMYYPKIEVLDEGHGFPPLAGLYDLRANLAQTLAEVLPEPQAALAQGILLGMRGNIPPELNSDFTLSGTSHLLAISGLNIGIMAGILLSLGLWLFGRRHYLYVWLAFVIIWFYTVITGLNPPVVRSAIMASLFLFAEALGRQRSGMAALTFAAAVMVGISPYILGDASFQLSFLAMAGLIFIYPVLRDAGRRLITARLGDEGFLVSVVNVTIDSMSATLAAIIAVWPLIAHYFGIFSLAGPIATFLAMPVLPVIIILGSLTMLLGLASVAVSQVLGWLVWPFLSYMILVVSGLAAPSVSSIKVDSISPVFIVCYYAVFILLIWLHSRWKNIRSLMSGASGVMKAGVSIATGFSGKLKWAIAPLLVIAVLVSYTAATMPDDELRVSFLDVGQGDAILIQKGSRQILIDGGPSPRSITLELSRQMPFWDRSIDLVVLTHPHQDHLAGLLEVLRRYDVGQVIYPALDYKSSLYDEWLRLVGETGVKSTIACAGQRIDIDDGVVLEVLWPSANLIIGSDSYIDNNSVILLLKVGEIKFLLTSDAMSEAEWELIRRRADIDGTVIKVAHHGSSSSTMMEFLAVVSPQAAVISVGANNTYGLPSDAVVERLEAQVGQENLYRTDIHGTINFITDGERLWVEN
ncbi:MAG: DNA internalization-related competence protein ComEC/Rec2 [Chloroflexi bacterium RBG_16_50_11]|nr:MAG: DNA internalization-related competence protein ComEC/Rec2 [Chloroflexi bacterium RBG_16_50_11]